MGELHEDQATNLERIRAWMEARSRKTGSAGIATVQFQRDLIAEEIKKWEKLFDFDAHIVTLREARGMIAGLLRPVFTKPGELYGFFADPKGLEPFLFDPKCLPTDGIAFPDYRPPEHHQAEDETSAPTPLVHTNLIETAKLFLDPSIDADQRADGFMSNRILKFLNSVGESGDPMLKGYVRQLRESQQGYCLVIGATDTVASVGPDKFSYTQLIAVYFVAGVGFDKTKLEREVQQWAWGLFSCLKLIKALDVAQFERDSLALLSHLAPCFHNPSLPLADKIAYSIECTRHLLEGHLLGFDYSSAELASARPKVTYIETSFRRLPNRGAESHMLWPIFQIYPEVYRNETPIAAFLVAHPNSLAVAKYALHRYFEQTAIFLDGNRGESDSEVERKLSPAFAELFQSQIANDLLEKAKRRAKDTGRLPDEFCISEFEGEELWTRLHISADSERREREASSTLTYIVEGARCIPNRDVRSTSLPRDRRQLPHGILVIESPMGDAFANSDIQSLRVLAAGISSLIRSIRHPSSPIDYEQEIETSFKIETAGKDNGTSTRGKASDTTSIVPGPLASAFLFQMIRLDAAIYKGIVRSSDQRITELTGLSGEQRNEIYDAHKDILVEVSDHDSVNRQHELLRERRQVFLKNIAALDRLYAKLGRRKVFDFFSACPSNYIWGAYLGAAAQVLGDRADRLPPSFSRIGVGFSADALLIADIKGELKQIIKLSSQRKLSIELNRYLRFVRYKLPFSARIPVTALAMDSSGQAGKSALESSRGVHLLNDTPQINLARGLPPYGALVSDLVDGGSASGGASVSTLLTRVADIGNAMRLGKRDFAGKETQKMVAGIKEYFGVGLSLWSNLSDGEKAAFADEYFYKENGHNVAFEVIFLQKFRLTVEDRDSFESGLTVCLTALRRENVSKLWKILTSCARDLKHRDPQQRTMSGQLSTLEDMVKLVQTARSMSARSAGGDELTQQLDREKMLSSGASPAIIHGDMNAQNLAWAAAFSRFFSIDFEHTGYGFWGMDQARLIYSIVTDLFFELYSRSKGPEFSVSDRPDIVEYALTEVQLGLNFIDSATDFLDGGRMGEYVTRVPDLLTWYVGLIESPLLSTLFAVLSTISKEPIDSITKDRNVKNLKAESLSAAKMFDLLYETKNSKKTPITFMLMCAATKELEYALKDVDDSVVECLSNAANALAEKEPDPASVAQTKLAYPLNVVKQLTLLPDVSSSQVRAASRLLIAFSALLVSAQRAILDTYDSASFDG